MKEDPQALLAALYRERFGPMGVAPLVRSGEPDDDLTEPPSQSVGGSTTFDPVRTTHRENRTAP